MDKNRENARYVYVTPSSLPEEYDVTTQDLWQGLKEVTSAHGIPHVTRARGPIKRAFWSVTAGMTVVALVYNLYAISMLFFKYPVVVSVSLHHKNEQPFPAVTICNMSPVRASSLGNSSLQNALSEQTSKRRRKRKKRSVGSCLTGWTYYSGSDTCFRAYTIGRKAVSAQKDCQILGGNLASITDSLEQAFVESISIDVEASTDYWIGLERSGGSWKWYDGSTFSYNYWFPGEPNGSGDCVRIVSAGRWRDRSCDDGFYKYGYVCEMPPESPTTTVEPTTEAITTTAAITTQTPTTVEETTTQTTEAPTTVQETTTQTSETPTTETTEAKTTAQETTTQTTETPTTVQETTTETTEAPATARETTIQTTEPPTTVQETTTQTTEAPTTVQETTTQSTDAPTTVKETTTQTTEPPTTVQETTTETTRIPTTVQETTTKTTEAQTTVQETTTQTTETPTTVQETTTQTTKEPTTARGTTTQTTETQTTLQETTTRTTENPTTVQETTTQTVEASTTVQETTTLPVKTTTEDAIPFTEKVLSRKCCCTCCFGSSGGCASCTGSTISRAATCAVDSYVPIVENVTESEEPLSVVATPAPLEGSKYPERVETTKEFKEEEQLTESLASTSLQTKATLGSSAEDLILDCQYAGMQCYLRDFTQFYNPIHGNCYIFNSGWNSSTALLTSKKAGRRNGLHLTLNIDQDEYLKEAGETAGIRLLVHSQDRMPFPEDEGITIDPGHATSVGMRKVVINRLPSPYGNCRPADKMGILFDAFAELYPVHYSLQGCVKTCYQRHMVERCQCLDSSYPLEGEALEMKGELTVCDSSNITQDDCRYELMELFKVNSLSCDCPSPCSESYFPFDLSSGNWPSNIQKEDILTRLAPKLGNMLSDPSNPNKYKENLVKLEVYYQELNFEELEEKPGYPPQNYLSDLGGVCGLWLGMSILTFFEFAEFCIDLLVLLFARCCARRQSGKQGQSSEKPANHGRATLSSPISKRKEAFAGRATMSSPIPTADSVPTPKNPYSGYYNRKVWPAFSSHLLNRSSSDNSVSTPREGALTAGSTEQDPEDLEVIMSPPPSYSSCSRTASSVKSNNTRSVRSARWGNRRSSSS